VLGWWLRKAAMFSQECMNRDLIGILRCRLSFQAAFFSARFWQPFREVHNSPIKRLL
jgi:hypothetical protein